MSYLNAFANTFVAWNEKVCVKNLYLNTKMVDAQRSSTEMCCLSAFREFVFIHEKRFKNNCKETSAKT